MRRAPAFLALALVLLSCGTDFEEQPEVVDRLRVLAIRVDPPDARPGDTVSLSALVADPFGPRDLAYTWVVCPTAGAPGVAADVGTCANRSLRVTIAGTETATLEIPADLEPPAEGVDLVVGLEVGASGGEWDLAAKRVRVTATPANANPSVTNVLLDGSPLTSPREIAWSEVHDLGVQGSDSDESLEGELFVSSGSFGLAGNRGVLPFEVSWLLEGERPARGQVWAVVRDGRGGIDFAAREVTFRD